MFKKKCVYCKTKIEKGKEIFQDVKVPGLIGTRKKEFCCKKHVNNYEKEVEEYLNKPQKGGSCCG
jgi:hypothetical protein